MPCDRTKPAILIQPQGRILCGANAHRAGQDGFETPGSRSPGELEMTWKNFRRSGLLLQQLGKIVGALAQFVKKPRILDGDDGLRRENFHQPRSACLSNGRPLGGKCRSRLDQFILLKHRHDQHCSCTGGLDQPNQYSDRVRYSSVPRRRR